MKSRVAVARKAVNDITTESKAEEQLLEVAKLALKALSAMKRGNIEKAMEIVPGMAQAGDRAGLTVVGVAMGDDFGPYTQPPVFKSYN